MSPTGPQDSLQQNASADLIRGQIRFSSDTLSDVVDYTAKDSIRLDNVDRLIYLYGEASITYQSYSITADFIRVDLDSNIAYATQLPDSLKKQDLFDEATADEDDVGEDPEAPAIPEIDFDGDPELALLDSMQRDSFTRVQMLRSRAGIDPNIVDGRTKDGRPYFDDGNSQFTADAMKFNFKTKKGKIYQAVTQESALFIHGSETKFVSVAGDSLTPANDFIYSRDALFTTCNAPIPHYGIRSRKQKIIPNRQVIVGASNVEIANVPTPLFLPFGFFPMSSGPKNGLIFPRDYEYSQEWGFGLRDIGYYFPISDHIDLQVTGDIYFKGSWGVRALSNYRKRYKFNGSFDLGYSDRKREVILDGTPQDEHDKSFSISWRHSQDSRAHPNRTFSASVRMQTNGYEQLNYNDAERVLNSQYSSNINFRIKFPDSPFSLSTNMTHSQNTRSGAIQFTLPDVNLNMNRIFPFKSQKNRSPEPKWYEKISVQYQGKFLNRIRTQDSLLFQQSLFKDAEMGAQHRVNTSASFRILKYFNVTPAFNVEENWYFKTLQKTFDNELDIVLDTVYNADSTDFVIMQDTLSFGSVIRDTLSGFDRFSEYTASISLSTQLFGSLGVGRKKGWFRGIRHVMKPTLSFNFSPDYRGNENYVGQVQTDIRFPDEFDTYSFFEGGLFGTPPTTGRRMALSYSINNLIEAKIFSRKDSTDRKIKLFNTIAVSGSHNFVADSLKWTHVNVSGNTSLFKNVMRLQFRARWDPYAVNDEGRRVNTSYWSRKRRPLRFDQANFRVSSGFSIEQIRDFFIGKDDEESNSSGNRGGLRSGGQQTAQNLTEQSLLEIFSNFRINHDLVFGWMDDNRDGIPEFGVRTNSVNTRGSIMLSPKWNINVSNIGYDFRTKRLTYPNIGIMRDLHCWEMGFNWAPTRSYYSFYIRVRQSPLDFLNLPYRRGNQDGFRRF
ncbi:MAG: hypothetical protein KTR24_06535 [Saprospiraceae bacterium]|nr:hypothetical protein [Saprospiraceae bacterium]